MARVLLVSANFGGRDDVFPLPPHPDVRGVYYTDAGDCTTAGAWEIINPSYPSGSSRARSKFFKCQIHRLDVSGAFPWLAWVDASLEFRDTSFLPQMADRLDAEGRLAAFFPHPRRTTVQDEYSHVISEIDKGNAYLRAKCYSDVLRESAGKLRRRVPDLDQVTLWSGGAWLLANVPRIHAMLDDWFSYLSEEMLIDQPALGVALKVNGIEPVPFEGDVYVNPWLIRHGHPRPNGTPLLPHGRNLILCCGGDRRPGFVRLDANTAVEPDILATIPPLPGAARGPWDRIELIHGIEHFALWEAEVLIREINEALAPGGVLVLEQPNIDFAARALLSGREDRWSMWPFYGDPGHRDPLYIHRWGYNVKSLTRLLERKGKWSRIRVAKAQFHVPGRDFRIEATR